MGILVEVRELRDPTNGPGSGGGEGLLPEAGEEADEVPEEGQQGGAFGIRNLFEREKDFGG